MKRIGKILILILVFVIISIALYLTGKKHNIVIENNGTTPIKYSINGEAYKTLAVNKKVKIFSKGLNNVIFIKNINEEIIQKNLPAKDLNIYVKEMLDNSEYWFKEIKN